MPLRLLILLVRGAARPSSWWCSWASVKGRTRPMQRPPKRFAACPMPRSVPVESLGTRTGSRPTAWIGAPITAVLARGALPGCAGTCAGAPQQRSPLAVPEWIPPVERLPGFWVEVGPNNQAGKTRTSVALVVRQGTLVPRLGRRAEFGKEIASGQAWEPRSRMGVGSGVARGALPARTGQSDWLGGSDALLVRRRSARVTYSPDGGRDMAGAGMGLETRWRVGCEWLQYSGGGSPRPGRSRGKKRFAQYDPLRLAGSGCEFCRALPAGWPVAWRFARARPDGPDGS